MEKTEHIFSKETFFKKDDYELYKYIIGVITYIGENDKKKKIKINYFDTDISKDVELLTNSFTRSLNSKFNHSSPNRPWARTV